MSAKKAKKEELDFTPWLTDLKSLFHVYIGGPMSGYPNFNYDTFYEVETELNLHGLPGVVPGIVVINPARNFEGDQTRPRREYLALAVTQILDCQAMVLLPGWQDSPGVQLEVQLAYNNGLSFYCAVKAPGDPCYTVHPVSAMSVKSVLDASESLDPMPPEDDPEGWDAPESTVCETIEEEASRIVRNGKRQQDYGHPRGDFDKIAAIWSAILDCKVTAEYVAICMMGLKLARLTSNPKHHDSKVDVIGYTICLDRLDEEVPS